MVRYFALVSVKCPFKSDDCEQCKERQVFKSMRTVQESRRLVEIYKALSSPSYILYAASEDPLLEAFTLCQEMVALWRVLGPRITSRGSSNVTTWKPTLIQRQFWSLLFFANSKNTKQTKHETKRKDQPIRPATLRRRPADGKPFR